MKRMMFAPGCALMLYKPELSKKLHAFLNKSLGEMEALNICCQHEPNLASTTEIINVCPGCDTRFRNDYSNCSTVSLWEILSDNDDFPFPDYHGQSMTILDACPTREQEGIHTAIRKVLQKMNISLTEPGQTRTRSICCGDSFYGTISTDKVKEQMVKRASEMPLDDVVVYCVSCIKSMYIGEKKPRYLVDLLFGEETQAGTFEPDAWHGEIDAFIDAH